MNTSSCLKILKDPMSPGTALVVAVDNLFRGQCFAWEFDTIFSELEEEYSVHLEPEVADRLMALLAIKANPAHLWDGSVFANLVETLNNNECLTDTYEQCSPGEVCWALKELELFGSRYGLPFFKEMYNDEPRIFMAACIAADGWVLLPRELDFCRDEYMRMARLDMHLTKDQEDKILELAAKKERQVESDSDVLDVQIAKLRECEAYVQHQEELLNTYLNLP